MISFLRTVLQCRPYAVATRHQAVFRRRSSTAAGAGAAAAGPLPLEGYRVLDMTRVLAGVSYVTPCLICGIPNTICTQNSPRNIYI